MDQQHPQPSLQPHPLLHPQPLLQPQPQELPPQLPPPQQQHRRMMIRMIHRQQPPPQPLLPQHIETFTSHLFEGPGLLRPAALHDLSYVCPNGVVPQGQRHFR